MLKSFTLQLLSPLIAKGLVEKAEGREMKMMRGNAFWKLSLGVIITLLSDEQLLAKFVPAGYSLGGSVACGNPDISFRFPCHCYLLTEWPLTTGGDTTSFASVLRLPAPDPELSAEEFAFVFWLPLLPKIMNKKQYQTLTSYKLVSTQPIWQLPTMV